MDLASAHPDWAPLIDPDGIQSSARRISDIDDGRLQQLYEHWDNARGNEHWLLHADFRPERCPLVLPYLSVIENRPNHDPSLFIRLTGEEIANRDLGFIKGRFVEQLAPDWYRDHLVSACRQVVSSGKPAFQMVRVVYGYHVALYRRLILPVSLLGNRVDVLLIAALRTRRLSDFISAGRLVN